MKEFKPWSLDIAQARVELNEYKALLSAKASLEEAADVLPFFKEHQQLAGFVGSYALTNYLPNAIAFEYPLFGEFTCDLVVGDTNGSTYCLVEFEHGKDDSIFKPRQGRSSPYWSRRFQDGFDQIVDWLTVLDDEENTKLFSTKFGSGQVRFWTLLVIGRSTGLDASMRRRIDWREEHVVVNSHKVRFRTFDDIAYDFEKHVEVCEAIARSADPTAPSEGEQADGQAG